MKISNTLFFKLFLYAFFCVTPHSSYSNYHSGQSPTTVTVISAFCTGSVLGTFWGYVDRVVPSSLRYLTTFPAAFALRVVLVNTISEALKKESIAHDTGNLFLASWLWEWIVYKNIAGQRLLRRATLNSCGLASMSSICINVFLKYVPSIFLVISCLISDTNDSLA